MYIIDGSCLLHESGNFQLPCTVTSKSLKRGDETGSESGKMIPIKPVKSSQTWIMIGRNSNKNIESQVYPYSVFRIRKFLGIKGGSGSVSQRYGSGSSHRQAKILRKPLISAVL
jgi:hypothetical protein